MRGKRTAEQPNNPSTPRTRHVPQMRQRRAVPAHPARAEWDTPQWDAPQEMSAASERRAAPGKSFPTLSSMPRVHRPASNSEDSDWPAYDDETPRPRQRAASTARPLARLAPPPSPAYQEDAESWDSRETWDDHTGWDDEERVEERGEDAGEDATSALTVRPTESPALASSHGAALARPRVATQHVLTRVRSRWSLVRLGLAVAATILALGVSLGQVGEPAQPFMALQARAASRGALNVAQQVKPLTSLKRPDQYDNATQFAIYSPAACSPSSMAEVLTAWGVPHATIGRMIDDLGSYLSPNWGLLDQKGFEAAAAKEGFRADISWHLTYNQLLYLTNVLGLPVIINVRRDYGYYHYFAGGHFLTVTGGDQQGVSIVDSSEYYITYLSRDVFFGLWQWRSDGSAQTVVLVPADYQYTLPAN